jgi:hypothetical protein
MKQFINRLKRIWQDFAGWVEYQWNSFINWYRFKSAKRQADKKHRLTGRRYHVIPAGKDKLIVIDNSALKYINQHTPKARRIDVKRLLEMSYYSTPVQPLTKRAI